MEYPCHKLPKDKWCDKNGPGGFMGHTCQPIQKRSEKGHRPQISPIRLEQTLDEIRHGLFNCLNEKGYGAWLSRHEISGVITEEYDEFKDEVHDGSLDSIKRELKDIAVGCIFAHACIDAGTLDW